VADRQRVLFLCTHNSARSQMTEGLVRHLAGDRFDAFSAGTEATHVRPLAIRAMGELGIEANEACPVFLGATERLHWSFLDPSRATGTEEEQLAVYRGVRDAIRARIKRDLIEQGERNP